MSLLARIRRRLVMLIAAMAILAAVLIGVGRFAFELFPGIQNEAQVLLAESLGRDVEIGEIDLGWTRWWPSVEMQQVVILNKGGDGEWLRFDELSIGLSKLGLLTGNIQPTELRLEEPVLDLSSPVMAADSAAPPTDPQETLRELGKTLRRLGSLVIENGEVHLPDPWNRQVFLRLTEVNLELSGREGHYDLSGSAMLPPAAGGALELEVDVLGSFLEPARMQYSGNLQVADPEPGFWLRPVFEPGQRVDFSESTIAMAFSGTVKNPGNLSVNAGIKDVSVANQPVFWREAALEMSAKPLDDEGFKGWQILLERFQAMSPDGQYEASQGEIRFQPNPLRVDARLSAFDLAAWGPWLQIARPFPTVPDPASLSPVGMVQNLLLAIREEVEGDAEVGSTFGAAPVQQESAPSRIGYTASAAVSQLSMGASGAIPGLSGISGDLKLDDSSGNFTLRGSEGHVSLPAVFAEKIFFNSLHGDIAWLLADTGIEIKANGLDANLPGNMQLSGGMSLGIPEGDAPSSIDLDMQFRADDIMPAKAMIPIDPDVFPVDVQTWLRESLRGGRVSNGRVQIRGALPDFPYQNADEPGLFRVDFDLDSGSLVYAEGWPEISAIAGNLVFQGRSMDIRANVADILGLPVGPARVWIEDFHEAVLKVDGKAAAPAPGMLGFLRASPLNEDFEHMLSVLDVQGPADLSLLLDIPLDDVTETRVDGKILLADNELRHSALPKPLEKIHGIVNFDNDGVHARDLKGRLFEQPVSVNLSPRVIKQGDIETTVIDVVANTAYSLPADREAMAQYLPPAVMQHVNGRAGVQMRMGIVDSPDPTPIKLNIDLTAMALNLPSPVGKNVGAPQFLNIELIPRTSGGADLNADYPGLATARLRWAGSGDAWVMDRGLVKIGLSKPAELPKESGLWLEGRFEQLDLDLWRRALLTTAQPVAAEQAVVPPSENPLRGAEVRADVLRVGGQRFRNVRAQVGRHPTQWWASVESPDISGTIEWSTTKERPIIQADIENLSLGTLSDSDKSEKPGIPAEEDPPIDPSGLPGLRLTVKNITLNETELGAAQIIANPITDGLRLATTRITGPGVDINGHGEWLRDIAGSSGRAIIAVSGNRIESVLAAAGYDPTLKAASTDINANLYWAANPLGLMPDSLNGELKLKLEQGALLAVDPGAGRALGLLNFYALPRRLQFDFSDITSDGLVFDELKGKFDIVAGNAYTSTLRMDGPSLKMRINGRTGLAAQDYDQVINIVPNIKSGVTLAGTVLGGPALGAALIIAQEVFEKPLEQISELQYHLGGTWDEPVVGDVEGRVAPTVPVSAEVGGTGL